MAPLITVTLAGTYVDKLYITSEKTFRKNEINVGMASRSIGRKEVGFIYMYRSHHKFSTRPRTRM